MRVGDKASGATRDHLLEFVLGLCSGDGHHGDEVRGRFASNLADSKGCTAAALSGRDGRKAAGMAAPPRAFISYSWSSETHERWVIRLATELVENGVDVILDKWELRAGNDALAFMEQMVTDPTITKVLVIFDRAYAEKADGRSGGVGTETQIITPEVYARSEQDKFVAILAERDENGNPHLPAYFKPRIYIDLSDSQDYGKNYEQLLRWIFDKPLHMRPPIGEAPSFLDDANAPSLGTTSLARRAIEAIKSDRPTWRGAFDEYLKAWVTNLERFRLDRNADPWDDAVVSSIEVLTPARLEYISVVTTAVTYLDEGDYAVRLHRFFEALIPYLSRPQGVSTWNEHEFDNFRFVIHESFLQTIAILVQEERYGAANTLLSRSYYDPERAERGQSAIVSFIGLWRPAPTFEQRNRRLSLRRLSLRADLLKSRAESAGIPFEAIMTSDLIAFLRSELDPEPSHHYRWWPETLLYAERRWGPLELFARCESRSKLSEVLPLLGISEITELRGLLERYVRGERQLPRWEHESFTPGVLLGFDNLGTRP